MIVSTVAGREAIGPPDTYCKIWWCWFIQGAGSQLPWNTVLMAHQYFEAKLCLVPAAKNFLSHFTLIFMFMRCMFMISGESLVRRYIQPTTLVRGSIICNVLFLTIMAILCISFNQASGIYYALLVTVIVIIALQSAFTEIGLMTLLCSFPAKYTHAFLLGGASIGVVVSLVHIMAAIWEPISRLEDIKLASTLVGSSIYGSIYLGSASFLLLVVQILFSLMLKLSTFRWYYQLGLVSSNAKLAAEIIEQRSGVPSENLLSVYEIAKELWDLCLALFIGVFTSMFIFPVFIFMTQSSADYMQGPMSSWIQTHWRNRDYFHMSALMVSSIFVLLGKFTAGFSFLVKNSARVPLLTIAVIRCVVTVPLILVGNIELPTAKLPWRPLYKSDLIFFFIIAIFSFSGGLVASLSIVSAPIRLPMSHRSGAMAVMIYAIAFGLILGALTAFGFRTFLVYISYPSVGFGGITQDTVPHNLVCLPQ